MSLRPTAGSATIVAIFNHGTIFTRWHTDETVANPNANNAITFIGGGDTNIDTIIKCPINVKTVETQHIQKLTIAMRRINFVDGYADHATGETDGSAAFTTLKNR